MIRSMLFEFDGESPRIHRGLFPPLSVFAVFSFIPTVWRNFSNVLKARRPTFIGEGRQSRPSSQLRGYRRSYCKGRQEAWGEIRANRCGGGAEKKALRTEGRPEGS